MIGDAGHGRWARHLRIHAGRDVPACLEKNTGSETGRGPVSLHPGGRPADLIEALAEHRPADAARTRQTLRAPPLEGRRPKPTFEAGGLCAADAFVR